MRRLINFLFTVFALAIALWIFGMVRFVATLPEQTKTETRADAIVVLTGGEDRLLTGLMLLQTHKSDRLLISGVAKGLTIDNLTRTLNIKNFPKDMRKRITLGYEARSTVQNASETAEWCETEGIHSIYLVTAAYHMKRSILEFEPVLKNVRIIPYPVYPRSMQDQKWWQSSKSFLLMAREYSKFLIASMVHIFGLTTEEFRT